MNRDCHYYAVLALSRACGFNKDSALTIAYASQFVDDAKINIMFINNATGVLEYDIIENRPAFCNIATCHSYFRVKTLNYEAMVNNTSAFHFVPGCKGENFTKKLRCQEESPVILDILNDVFLENDLIKLGIVLHAYADTFSHQGFSGLLSMVNDIKNCEQKTKVYLELIEKVQYYFNKYCMSIYEELFDLLIPAYGHIQAIDFPDIPYLVWSYEYDYSDEFNGSYKIVNIDNKVRYRRAFIKIKKYLEDYLIKHNEYADSKLKFKNLDILMDTLLLETTKKKKEEIWINFLCKNKLFSKDDLNLIIYDDKKWLKEAFFNFHPLFFNNRKVEGVQLAGNFINSYWYKFYLAVKWYKKKFFEYCSRYELNIPN